MPRPTLHPITQDPDRPATWWCGPAALSAVTGYTARDMADLIAARRGRDTAGRQRVIRGTYNGELTAVLAALGFTHSGWIGVHAADAAHGRPSLARWLRERTRDQRSRLAIVQVSGHYLAVQGNRLVDNRGSEPKGAIVPIGRAPRRRKLVRNVLWVLEAPRRLPAGPRSLDWPRMA